MKNTAGSQPESSGAHPSSGSPPILGRVAAIILAAGQGTRMKSSVPKVLHTLCGRPLVFYPVRAALEAGCRDVVVVVGHGADLVTSYLQRTFGDRVRTAVQETQRGTGDAARAGLTAVASDVEHVLIYYGDAPLLRAEHVAPIAMRLAGPEADSDLAIATCFLDDPFGYGRIVRDARGHVTAVREQKDLKSDAERDIREINPGIYAAARPLLAELLAALTPENAQRELYLTDIVEHAARGGKRVAAVASPGEVLVGINDRDQLVAAESVMYERIAREHRRAGVTVRAGARIDDSVVIDKDTTVETGAVLRGATRIGGGAVVDVGCVLTNAVVEDGVLLRPYSVVADSVVRARAQIGPFSHVRPDSDIGSEAHVGNFVETKKTRLGPRAKANHLAYLGDGVIAEDVNIGAGTIFCNYDGVQKHTTTIEAGAFVGSDSQIVAPVTIGAGAYIATGTTVTRDVPADALAIARLRQENKEGYAARLRARLKAAKAAAAEKAKQNT